AQREARRRAASAPAAAPARFARGPLFEALRRWRLEAARAAGAPPYTIFHDSTLAEIAALRPASLDALGRCHGVGTMKLARYGPAVLDVVRRVAGEVETTAPPDALRPN